MYCAMSNKNIYILIFFFQENSGLVVPWIIGFITFMALEAVAMVYSNVLRDHVNRVSGYSFQLLRKNKYQKAFGELSLQYKI